MFCIAVVIVHDLKAQVKEFEVIGRRQAVPGTTDFLGMTKNNTAASYQVARERNKVVYKVTGSSGTVTIDALSNIEHAKQAERIVTYGDSLHKHVVSKAYVRIYSGSGALVKSLGLVARWPFAATLAENGDFIIAGNKSNSGNEVQMFMACFNKDGVKLWERSLPNIVPTKIYSAHDRKYIALVLDHPETLKGNVSYYNRQGNLIFTDWNQTGISGIEFLASDKVVVATGNIWNLYSIPGNFTLLASGTMEGNAIGRHPITAHPTKDLFFIVSMANKPQRGFRLQAVNGKNGSVISESVFGGQPFWQPYRLAEVVADDRINLITTNEMIELRIRQ